MSVYAIICAGAAGTEPTGDGGDGLDGGAGSPPTVNDQSFVASSNRLGQSVTGQFVGTITTSGTPTSFSIVGGSGYFAVNDSGDITVTSTGHTNIAPTRAGATYNLVVNATNLGGTSDNVTIPIKFYPDGALDAPIGTIQRPDLFEGYAGGPEWAVAGVDYYVGLPSGLTLKDPRSDTLPSGTSYSSGSHTVTIGSDNTTFELWDMSVGNGIGLVVEGANAIIRKNKFIMGSNAQVPILVNEGGDNVLITSNLIDEDGVDDAATFGGVIYVTHADATSGMTIEYNEIRNGAADMIDVGGGLNIIRYNLITNDGETTGEAHPDFVQSNPFSLPTTYTQQIAFNTMINTYAFRGDGFGVGGGQGAGIGDNECPVVGTNWLDNNIMIADGPGNPGDDLVSISYWCIIEYASLQTGATVSIQHNWADLTSAYGFGYSGGTGAHATWADNKDLNDLSALTPTA